MDSRQSASDSVTFRPLEVLRVMIDALDREILQLLARRNGLVAEVAEHKRAHALAIRDHQRERELLHDRRQRAQALGLSPELVESMFRLILWGSRDRQAALKAEVPLDLEPRTVAVIGGQGGMGRCMAELFGDLGHAVIVADTNTRITSTEAARLADVVLISVPIGVTEDVIRQLGPLVRPEALMMDITSIKTAPMQAMLESTSASVVGTHPLFGPSVHSLQGQRIVLTRGRGDAWFDWARRMFHARGLSIKEATAEDHDRTMAIVQVLVHFATEVMGRTLADLGVEIEQTLEFTSPIYRMELLMTARHFAQSPDLYASIQMSNPATPEVTAAFVKAAEEMRAIAARHDHKAFQAVYEQVHALFGDYTDRALHQSDFLIDRLVERD
ncbi:MAG: bifunctional chorismate mutase/prephenate dehydrogenase [Planctomycetes bacterium]|nr:bifunctional chorismate mutase/prephenate dehydrogenase [Planctomycetota bacterium]